MTSDDASLEKFRIECEKIQKVLSWASSQVEHVSQSQQRGGSVVEEEEKLENVESKVQAVRRRLKRIAEENKEYRKENPGKTANIRTRVVQHTRLAKEFMEVVGELEKVKEARRSVLRSDLENRVVGVVGKGNLGRNEVGEAIDEGNLDMLVENRGGLDARYQLQDVRERNREIEIIGKKMKELHQMFVDMSIIVDGQQDLLNQIEYNVNETVPAVKSAAGQLEIAREHQKKKRKKIICLCVLVLILIIVIVAIILIVFRKDIFGGDDNNNNSGGGGGTNGTRLLISPDIELPKMFVKLEEFEVLRNR